eukprot:TRINITY_DN423_c0_g1_i2.p1 TRINITY_DN423_c0_g1~~TRINITY_DN423_c0_g1_i2.p1  ORF type:complete len:379 (+),score=102.90 TRINITY_DN423_c0_g1_i2:48-1139(+)
MSDSNSSSNAKPHGPCRLGILSTANIANKNVSAVKKLPESLIVVAAVASRSLEKAKEFAEKHQIPKAYGTYEELLDDKEIDAIYIPLPTSMHKEWVLKAAAKGKHIQCDKPVGVTLDEVVEMVDAVTKANVEFLDGVMYMHHSRLGEMADVLHKQKTIGNILNITTGFHFYASDEFNQSNIRVKKDLEPLGALGDLGWYNIRLSLWAFDYAWPVSVEARAHRTTSDGVPIDFSAAIYFNEEQTKKAYFHSSFCLSFQQWAVVSGDNGTLSIRDFVLPKKDVAEYELTYGKDNFERRTSAECTQEVELWRTLANAVINRKEGKSGLDEFWKRVIVQTQAVIDACVQSAATGQLVRVTRPPTYSS